MYNRKKSDLIEVFGHSPDDISVEARTFWNMEACPFIYKKCTKSNHDGSVVYGTCSVSSKYGDCIICPNRLYADKYAVLRRISEEVFGGCVDFFMYEEYIKSRNFSSECIVALGMNSGKEIKVARSMSMDWVLAKVSGGKLMEYVGIEVQSIDITGNYRDAWYFYKNISNGDSLDVPSSAHGMNWANVHKRLIPQIIRKGIVYSKSKLVNHGLYFIVPDIVYQKFEEIIGRDIPLVDYSGSDIVSVHTGFVA